MERTKRVILVGPGGSGKDYLAKKFSEAGFSKDISFTTRKRRENEIAGIDYHYISEEEFLRLKSENYFYEYDNFKDNYYGTSMKAWRSSDIFIQTPQGMEKIKPEDRKDCIVVYLEISEEVRRKRLAERKDAKGFTDPKEVNRRIEADNKAFSGFIDYDYRIKNENFDADEWVKILGYAMTTGRLKWKNGGLRRILRKNL